MKLNPIKKNEILVFGYILSIIITFIVYFTGGTNKVYPNFMYIPIVMIASTKGKYHGAFHGAVSALLIGPYMPLVVSPYQPQDLLNWVFRLLIFVLVAFVVGFFADFYKEQSKTNIKNKKEIIDSQLTTIFALVKLAESRDDETGTHIERVTRLCQYLASKLKNIAKYNLMIDDEYINKIYNSSSLHDIGKVGIPDKILLKPGKLTKDEFDIIKRHTLIGAKTLLDVHEQYPHNNVIESGIKIALYHHEKWDGSGYPNGLKEEDIPLEARIMAIVDVYEALRSKRVYKDAFTHEKSITIIKEGRNTHFDPVITDVFIENEQEIETIFQDITAKFKDKESLLIK